MDLFQCGGLGVLNQENVRVTICTDFAMQHRESWNRDIHYSDAGYRAFAGPVQETIMQPSLASIDPQVLFVEKNHDDLDVWRRK